MSQTLINIANPAGFLQYTDSNIGASADGVKSSSAVLYSVFVDNSANAAASYVKLYNVASGSVVVGTTAPDEVIYVPAGVVIEHFFYTGSTPGKTFATALSAACVTTGGTGGTTAPLSAVKATLNFV